MTKPDGTGEPMPTTKWSKPFTAVMRRPFPGTLWADCAIASDGNGPANFEPINRHLIGGHRAVSLFESREIAAMSALLDLKDDAHATHAPMMTGLRELPVRHHPHASI
jgi:hypothetical protein